MTNCTPPENYRAAPDLLKDRVILVTGAGDGIGRAAALAYAAHGATVILLGRTEEKLAQVYDQIKAEGGADPAMVCVDLAELTEEQAAALAAELGETFGCLHGLLHNASLLGERTPIGSASLAQWQQVMRVNVDAAFLLTRYLLPLLEAAPRASVLFTSSGVGRKGRAFWGAYAVSKFATEGLMQVLADELENTGNVRVNSLNPGATNTAMRRSAYPAEKPDSNPTPEDIMPAYLYFMGDDSADINGQACSVR